MDFTAKKGTPVLPLAMSNNEANDRASGYGNHINKAWLWIRKL
jgi:hypothetical protein